jgi:hypothetical protein
LKDGSTEASEKQKEIRDKKFLEEIDDSSSTSSSTSDESYIEGNIKTRDAATPNSALAVSLQGKQ